MTHQRPKTFAELGGELNTLADAFLKARVCAYNAGNKNTLRRACKELERLEDRMGFVLLRRSMIRNACAAVTDALRLVSAPAWVMDSSAAVWTHFDDNDCTETRYRVRVDFASEELRERDTGALIAELKKRGYTAVDYGAEAASLIMELKRQTATKKD